MKKITLLLLIVLVCSCSKKESDLKVIAHIDGLQKGTVYLKQVIDTNLVTVDSFLVKSAATTIELESSLAEPDLFFLYLDKHSKTNERIAFFADKGITEIHTSLKDFIGNAKIKGSKQHVVLENYQNLVRRLNHRNLDLIKEKFEAQKLADTNAISAVNKKQDNLIKNRYLQTVNFAINNKDSEVAPYLALSEIYNANTTLLDTIYKSLAPHVKASKYGKKLGEVISERQQAN